LLTHKQQPEGSRNIGTGADGSGKLASPNAFGEGTWIAVSWADKIAWPIATNNYIIQCLPRVEMPGRKYE